MAEGQHAWRVQARWEAQRNDLSVDSDAGVHPQTSKTWGSCLGNLHEGSVFMARGQDSPEAHLCASSHGQQCRRALTPKMCGRVRVPKLGAFLHRIFKYCFHHSISRTNDSNLSFLFRT